MTVPFKFKQYYKDLYAFLTAQTGKLETAELGAFNSLLDRPFSKTILDNYNAKCPLDVDTFLTLCVEGQSETKEKWDDILWGYATNFAKMHVFQDKDEMELKPVRSMIDPGLRAVKMEPALTVMWKKCTDGTATVNVTHLVAVLKEMSKTMPMLDLFRLLLPKGGRGRGGVRPTSMVREGAVIPGGDTATDDDAAAAAAGDTTATAGEGAPDSAAATSPDAQQQTPSRPQPAMTNASAASTATPPTPADVSSPTSSTVAATTTQQLSPQQSSAIFQQSSSIVVAPDQQQSQQQQQRSPSPPMRSSIQNARTAFENQQQQQYGQLREESRSIPPKRAPTLPARTPADVTPKRGDETADEGGSGEGTARQRGHRGSVMGIDDLEGGSPPLPHGHGTSTMMTNSFGNYAAFAPAGVPAATPGGGGGVGATRGSYMQTTDVGVNTVEPPVSVLKFPTQISDFVEHLDKQRDDLQRELENEIGRLADCSSVIAQMEKRLGEMQRFNQRVRHMETHKQKLEQQMSAWIEATQSTQQSVGRELSALDEARGNDTAQQLLRQQVHGPMGAPAAALQQWQHSSAMRVSRFYEQLSQKEREIKDKEEAIGKIKALEKHEEELLREIGQLEEQHRHSAQAASTAMIQASKAFGGKVPPGHPRAAMMTSVGHPAAPAATGQQKTASKSAIADTEDGGAEQQQQQQRPTAAATGGSSNQEGGNNKTLVPDMGRFTSYGGESSAGGAKQRQQQSPSSSKPAPLTKSATGWGLLKDSILGGGGGGLNRHNPYLSANFVKPK